jgi:hypothetical protein
MEKGPKKDCFGYVERRGIKNCTALDALYCNDGEDCAFYKKRRQNDPTRNRIVTDGASGKTFK